MKKQIRREGDVVAISLGDGTYAFGIVLAEPQMVFFDLRSSSVPPVEEILDSPEVFRIWVMNSAITGGRWQVIGNIDLGAELRASPVFFREDPITNALYLYQSGKAWPAAREDCEGLERAAVWSASHVEDRLRDHFAGRTNKWVESLRLR
jgi:hypothetical protein